jgi:hypothetical protein
VFFPHLPQWPLSQGKRSVFPFAASPCRSPRCPVATEIPGTFRVNGSNRRMRDLQVAFESPPRVSLHPPRSSIFPNHTHIRHPPNGLYSPSLLSVRQIPRLEARILYHPRCCKRVSEIPNPDARQSLVQSRCSLPCSILLPSVLFNLVTLSTYPHFLRNQLFLMICIT